MRSQLIVLYGYAGAAARHASFRCLPAIYVAVLAIGAKITSIFALATSVGADAANAAILAAAEDSCFQSYGVYVVLSC